MKKTYQIHLRIELDTIEKLKKEANDKNITLAELCREKLRNYCLLTKIFEILEEIKMKVSIE